MASYRLLIKPSAAKEIESAPKKDRLRIIKRIQELPSNPRPPGSEKLSGHDDKYRVRQGAYRIVYSISDVELVVCVVKSAIVERYIGRASNDGLKLTAAHQYSRGPAA